MEKLTGQRVLLETINVIYAFFLVVFLAAYRFIYGEAYYLKMPLITILILLLLLLGFLFAGIARWTGVSSHISFGIQAVITIFTCAVAWTSRDHQDFPLHIILLVLCVYSLSQTWRIHVFTVLMSFFLVIMVFTGLAETERVLWLTYEYGAILILGEIRYLFGKRRERTVAVIQDKMLHTMEEAFSVGKIEADTNGNPVDFSISLMNVAMERVTGLKASAILYKPMNQVLEGLGAGWVTMFAETCNRKIPLRSTEYVPALKKYLTVSTFPVDDEYFGMFITDATQSMLREKELKYAIRRSEKADRMKTQFLRDVNHRIRTPLNGMMGMSQLIDLKDMGENNRELYSAMMLEMQHLRNIINQISRYVEIQGTEYRFVRCCPLELMKTIIRDFPDGKIDIQTMGSLAEQEVYMEKTVLTRVFTEMIANGLKHTKEQKVTVRLITDLKPHENTVSFSIEIQDYGNGIPKEQLEYIFNEFYDPDFMHIYKAEDSLSIPMCRQMLVSCGGEMYVKSSEGIGTTFTLQMPVALSEHNTE